MVIVGRSILRKNNISLFVQVIRVKTLGMVTSVPCRMVL